MQVSLENRVANIKRAINQSTGRWGATGEELNTLYILVEFAQDYWRRQSGLRMNRCINQLKIVREKQFAELEKKAA